MPTITIDVEAMRSFDAPQSKRIRMELECSGAQLMEMFEEAWNKATETQRETMREFVALQAVTR